MDTVVLKLPVFWASALVNSDESGMQDSEIEQLNQFVYDFCEQFGSCHCIDVSEDTEFMIYHDAIQYGILACDVAEFTFSIE